MKKRRRRGLSISVTDENSEEGKGRGQVLGKRKKVAKSEGDVPQDRGRRIDSDESRRVCGEMYYREHFATDFRKEERKVLDKTASAIPAMPG